MKIKCNRTIVTQAGRFEAGQEYDTAGNKDLARIWRKTKAFDQLKGPSDKATREVKATTKRGPGRPPKSAKG